MIAARIDSLRAELRDDTAFVATATPRLTWTVESEEPGWLQAAADLTDGAATGHGRAAATACSSRGPSPRSPQGRLARSLCAPARPTAPRPHGAARSGSRPAFSRDDEWVAQPIGLADPARDAQPALVRTTFAIDRPVRQATLFWTALGAAEPELNGAPVADDVLSPGWTSYRDRLVHETVDVTALIREGENVLGATIAGAWYTEKYGFFDFADRLYGTQPSFLAQLRVTYADGAVETLAATGDGWHAFGDGPVVDSGIYPGEHQDLRLAVPAGRRRASMQRPGLRRASAPRRARATRTSRCPKRGSHRRCAASTRSPSSPRSRHPRAARSSTSVRTSSAACGCACAARRGSAS